jgi:hypothetical protein
VYCVKWSSHTCLAATRRGVMAASS